MILEDAGLDKNGDLLPDRDQPPKRKDKKDVNIYKLEQEDGENISPKKKKANKKNKEEESEKEVSPKKKKANKKSKEEETEKEEVQE